jgi:spore germination protein GerM
VLNKSIRLLVLAACVLIAASGCGQLKQEQVNQKEPSNKTNSMPNQSVLPSTTPQDEKKVQQINVYFGNEDGSGLTEKMATLHFTTPSSKYLSALNALKQSDDSKAVSLCPNFTFKTAEWKDGNLTIDLSFTPNDQLGANGESLLMQAIPKTLFQFDEVKTIDLLVDGKKLDSLMGHVDLPHPLTRQ